MASFVGFVELDTQIGELEWRVQYFVLDTDRKVFIVGLGVIFDFQLEQKVGMKMYQNLNSKLTRVSMPMANGILHGADGFQRGVESRVVPENWRYRTELMHKSQSVFVSSSGDRSVANRIGCIPVVRKVKQKKSHESRCNRPSSRFIVWTLLVAVFGLILFGLSSRMDVRQVTTMQNAESKLVPESGKAQIELMHKSQSVFVSSSGDWSAANIDCNPADREVDLLEQKKSHDSKYNQSSSCFIVWTLLVVLYGFSGLDCHQERMLDRT